MNRSESKYFNTAIRMDEAFLELLSKKDFEFITVKEICEKADVNRSTFYLHYENIGELLAESIGYINERFFTYFPQKDEMISGINGASLEELYLITPAYLIPYLTYVKENKDLFRLAIKRYTVLQMDSNFRKLCEYILNPILERYRVPEAEMEYILAFYIEGIIAVIRKWLELDCITPVERMAEIIMENVKKTDG